jgi:formate dehydrogenase major subunit
MASGGANRWAAVVKGPLFIAAAWFRLAVQCEEPDMTDTIRFTLDGATVEALPGQTIWEVAKAQGTVIPHLCHKDAPGYRSDGNCRACMVAIDGERVLAASCIREPSEGMVVSSQGAREKLARRMVMELLVSDQPKPEVAHDKSSHLWDMAAAQDVSDSRFPAMQADHIPLLDDSHVAMRVNLDACIQCGLCVRACREVQVNDVIGMAGRGHDAYPVFDMDDPMGNSTCVACGECVQACPTGALMPATVLDAAQIGDSADYDSETQSVCPFCGVGCQVSLKVKDGKVKFVEGINGPANEGRLCVKGRFGFDYIHHPHRLTVPLIRRDDAPAKGLNVDPANWQTHFREASWDEALDFAAGGLALLRDRDGGKSVAGFGSAKCTNEEAYLFQKLIRQGFGHNNVDHCTRLCHASSVAALMENVGSGAVTATFNEIENADVAIVIGANPVENHPVAATYFKQFTKRGGKLIVMDPRGVGLRRFASQMLQFRPGSDVSMLNAIMHVIVEEGLVDRQYIAAYTENFEAQKEHLKDFTPEKMSAICGIAPEVLRDVARTFAGAKSAMIFWGMGISQHIHGTDNSRCLISLALMTGQVGRPGTGLHPLRGQNNVQGASDAGLIPMFLPDMQSVTDQGVRTAFEGIWGDVTIDAQKGLTVTEIMDAVHDGQIHGMYILGENPAMSDPDVDHARDALAKLSHLVVQDIFITETANYADVILPASAFAEKSGTVTNTNRQVQIGRPALLPPGLAREDWWIEVELAKRLGLGWTYTHPREVFAEMKRSMKSFDNITWDRLEAENAVTYPSLSPTDPGQPIVFGNGFPRAGGRAKFTPASVIAPDEVPDGDYPMILTTGRQLEHWHTGSMTRRSKVLDRLEPEANCSLHPATLRKLGVAPGGMLRLTTRRGSITLMARADRAVSEDMVFVPFAYVEAAANILTNPAVDPYGKIPEFKFAAVRVEKADDAVAAE